MKDIIRRAEFVRIYRKAKRLGILSQKIDAVDKYKRIFGVSRTRREAYELMALYDTVRYFISEGKEEVLSALTFVYGWNRNSGARPAFYYPKSEISMRVLKFADSNHYDERTVWRMLLRATDKFYEFKENYRK